MTSQEEPKILMMMKNDFPDADNFLQLIFGLLLAQGKSNIEPVIILEPRAVDFSLETLKPDDQERLNSLLKQHFSHVGDPLKVRLNGLLTKLDIDNVKEINETDRALLHMAVKSSHGSEEDSKLHASLMARDFARCLSELGGLSKRYPRFSILVDFDGLHETSPINLKCHVQEQLFNRSLEEIKEYYDAMKSPERREKIRQWYKKCIDADEKLGNTGFLVNPLNVEDLKERIAAADKVKYIEGASFKLLHRLIDDPAVAKKMDCLVQAGTLNLASNILNNQFNIALDPKSAKYVLDRASAFQKFIAVPTHTSKAITFSVDTLNESHFPSLARWILCFTLRNDPAKVSNGDITLQKDYKNKTVELPDLAMFLLGFGILPSQEARVELLSTEGEPLLFKISEKGIRILEPEDDFEYKPVDLGNCLSKDNKDGITVRFDI